MQLMRDKVETILLKAHFRYLRDDKRGQSRNKSIVIVIPGLLSVN